jgi:hypothetical protein
LPVAEAASSAAGDVPSGDHPPAAVDDGGVAASAKPEAGALELSEDAVAAESLKSDVSAKPEQVSNKDASTAEAPITEEASKPDVSQPDEAKADAPKADMSEVAKTELSKTAPQKRRLADSDKKLVAGKASKKPRQAPILSITVSAENFLDKFSP